MVRETSIEIYQKIIAEGLLSKKREQVYKIIYYGGVITGAQVAKKYKSVYPSAQHSESIRNRITELVERGVVAEVKTGPCPITGNTVMFFATTDNLPNKVKPKKTKKQKQLELLGKIRVLGNQLSLEVDKESLREIYKLVKQF